MSNTARSIVTTGLRIAAFAAVGTLATLAVGRANADTPATPAAAPAATPGVTGNTGFVDTGNYGGVKGTAAISLMGAFAIDPGNSNQLSVGYGYYFNPNFELRGTIGVETGRGFDSTGLGIAPILHFPNVAGKHGDPYVGLNFTGTHQRDSGHNFDNSTYGFLAGYNYFVTPDFALTGEYDWNHNNSDNEGDRDSSGLFLGITDFLNPSSREQGATASAPIRLPVKGAYEVALSGAIGIQPSSSTSISVGLGQLVSDKLELGGTAAYAHSRGFTETSIAFTPKYYFVANSRVRPYVGASVGSIQVDEDGTDTATFYGVRGGAQYMLNSNIAADGALVYSHYDKNGFSSSSNTTGVYLGLSVYFDPHADK